MAREIPALFQTDMVQALLRKVGPKTVTRRVVTDHTSQGNFKASEMLLDGPRVWVDSGPSPAGNSGPYLKAHLNAPLVESNRGWSAGSCCPEVVERLYPRWFPGDLLYVRETWAGVVPGGNFDEITGPPVSWPSMWQIPGVCRYRADGDPFTDPETRGFRWRPSIHMPKWASRIWLEVPIIRPNWPSLAMISRSPRTSERNSCRSMARLTTRRSSTRS